MEVLNDLLKKVKTYCKPVLFGFCLGIVLVFGISLKHNFFESGQNRTGNGKLTEEVRVTEGTVDLLEREVGILREELSTANDRLSESQSTLRTIREYIEECKRTTEDGLSDITTIREATERIRAEIIILQNFYDSVCSVYGDIDIDNNIFNEEVKK